MCFVSKAVCVFNRQSVYCVSSSFPKIVPRIVGPVLTVTIFATAAAYAWSHGYDISLTNSVVPLLSVVVRTVPVN